MGGPGASADVVDGVAKPDGSRSGQLVEDGEGVALAVTATGPAAAGGLAVNVGSRSGQLVEGVVAVTVTVTAAGPVAAAGLAASAGAAVPAARVTPSATSTMWRRAWGRMRRAAAAAARPPLPGSAASAARTNPAHSHSRQAHAARPTTVVSACSGSAVTQSGTAEKPDGRSARPGPTMIRMIVSAVAAAAPVRKTSMRRTAGIGNSQWLGA